MAKNVIKDNNFCFGFIFIRDLLSATATMTRAIKYMATTRFGRINQGIHQLSYYKLSYYALHKLDNNIPCSFLPRKN